MRPSSAPGAARTGFHANRREHFRSLRATGFPFPVVPSALHWGHQKPQPLVPMKTLSTFGIAAGLAGVVAVVTSLAPSLTRPVFSSYVVAVLFLTALFDYTRGRAAHRYF